MLLLVTVLGVILPSPLKGSFGFEFPADEIEWTILIHGAVDQLVKLTLAELAAMPQTTVNAELWCVDRLVTTGNWIGVKLSLILEKAEIDPEALSVKFTAADGYKTELQITEAMREDVIIAYAKDGQTLPETLRLVFPGENGNRWISMITQIEISLDQAQISEMSSSPIDNLPLTSSEPAPTPTPSPTLPPTPSPSPDLSPSPSTLPATEPQNIGLVPMSFLAIASATVAGALLLFYFKRRNN
jgi:DMSO/TMAO reductase YedYZ molybdopterin-dependent catalytic subunit